MTQYDRTLLFGALTVASVLLIATTTDALAQSARNCAPRNMVVNRLAQSYGETRQAIGLAADSTVVELYAARDTGSWTITVTTPNGMTCLTASGQSFDTLHESLPTSGTES